MKLAHWGVAIWGLVTVLTLKGAGAAPFDRDFPVKWADSPINCVKARFTPDTTICRDPVLQRADVRIAQAYRQLDGMLKGEDEKVFLAGQQLWMVERNNCRNLSAVHGNPGIFECVQTTMNKRLETLRALIDDPAEIQATVADYSFVYPSYLSKFARQYAGKTVSVFGGIDIEACHKRDEHSLVGRLSNNGKLLEIRFKSLPAEQVEFLCSKQPISWWGGEVKLDGARPYLFATDVLGTLLP